MSGEVYSGIRTLFKSPIKDNDKKYSVIGIPYDKTSTYRSGSRFGPASIRDASIMLCDGNDSETGIDIQNLVSDYGDVIFDIVNNPLFDIKNSNQILLGGEHSITYMGLQRAYYQCSEKINVLHFDAHCDTWDTSEIEHGSFLRHAKVNGLVSEIYQSGIRSPLPDDVKNWNDMYVNKLEDYKLKDIIEPNSKWYITLDIDSIDPCYAPGTGTPESFGLEPKYVLKKMKKFIKYCNYNNAEIVGFDVVEVNPAYDNNQITSILAANFIWKYISYREYYND